VARKATTGESTAWRTSRDRVTNDPSIEEPENILIWLIPTPLEPQAQKSN